MNIKNLSLVLDVEAPSGDQVNWKINDAIDIQIEDF